MEMPRSALTRSALKRQAQSGFTLLELLVVLVIASLMLTLVGPRLAALIPGAELKGETHKVAALMRQAYSRAIVESRDIAVSLEPETRQLSITGHAQPYALPAAVRLSIAGATQGGAEMGAEAPAIITFFPDGSSSGGTITLESHNRRYRVAVDWLTGRVTIDG